ncbi:MAG: four helix bundle protein [Elusimicrobiales bacterium]|jgi:four helix bundle protein
MSNYKNLIAWQKSHEMALCVYRISENFPKKEMFGLTSQIRRACLSVPTNIVEGYNRKRKKEFAHFLDIALGSLAETQYLSKFAVAIGYMGNDDMRKIRELVDESGKLLWGLQKSQFPPSALSL